MKVTFTSQDLQTMRTILFATQNPKDIQKHELHRETVPIWSLLNAHGAEKQYYFNDELIRSVVYFKMLNIYDWSGAQ